MISATRKDALTLGRLLRLERTLLVSAYSQLLSLLSNNGSASVGRRQSIQEAEQAKYTELGENETIEKDECLLFAFSSSSFLNLVS